MKNALIEFGLYGSGSALATSILLKAIKINPWIWHSLALALALSPLIAIAVILYKPKQEEDFLSALKRNDEEPDRNQELVNNIFKWWVLRLMPIAIGVQLVFWGYV